MRDQEPLWGLPGVWGAELAATIPRNWPWRWARNQPPTAKATPPRISSSLPTTRLGRTMRARPPSSRAALVVTLATTTLRGGYTSDARPNTNRATPTQTMPLRLESLAPSSRAVSFWAAPSSVRAWVSSRSTTGIGALRRKEDEGSGELIG